MKMKKLFAMIMALTMLLFYIKKLDSSVEKNKKCCYKQHIVLNNL